MSDVQKKSRGRPRKDVAAREAERQVLVDAAVELICAGGSPALTARAVADRAGAAIGTVYGTFGNLEALKLEAHAITMRALRRHLADALDGTRGAPVVERLLCLAAAYLDFARANHNAWAAMFDRHAIEAPPAIAADIAALFGVIEAVLAELDGLAPNRIPVMAKALWSSVHGMVYLGELGGLGPVDSTDVPAMIEILVRAAVRGLSAEC